MTEKKAPAGVKSAASLICFRFFSILAAVAFHFLLLFFAVFTIKTVASIAEPRSDVMKLADIREEAPAPLPQTERAPVSEAPAENLIETDEIEPNPEPSDAAAEGAVEVIDYLPMHSISVLPHFSEEEIRKRVVYPPIAQRAGLTGTVYLEIFVDSHGLVRNVSILKEDPPDRGFGEAAVKAFWGMRGEPAQANGENVAVRYRYPVRFSLN
jgi:protein TonB